MTNNELEAALQQLVNRVRILEAAYAELQTVVETALATKMMVNQLHTAQMTRLSNIEDSISNLSDQIVAIQKVLGG